jgi:glyceraldehyde-3-phosphate dehydrogenase (NADP+)
MKADEKINTIFPEESGIPDKFRLRQEINQNEYLINGTIRKWNGPCKEVFSPICFKTANGVARKRIGSFPLLTEQIAMEALDSAVAAFDHGRGLWPTLPVEKRIRHVEEFLVRMKEKKSEVVHLLMWEIGKTLPDSEKEFDRTVLYLEDSIEALKNLDRSSSRFVIEQGILGQIRRSPLGAVLCMGPFNYPLNETFTTLLPALMMGNTVVFKPPKHGVLLHRPLLEAFRDSFPQGVVNTIYGEGSKIIGPLMASGKVHVLALIGSSRVADVLKKQHPEPHRLRCVFGLGAKNPAIILPDADMDLAVKECLLGTLSYNGQRCTALKILFVHSKIIPVFLERFAREVNQLGMGLPWEEQVQITPLPEPNKPAWLADLIEDAKQHGAKVVNEGGGTIAESFFYPAVLYPVTPQMKIYSEEQFGPVVPVVPFDDLDQPVRYIVESNYGQQVSLFGNDPDTIAALVDPLVNQVSRVNINCQCQRGPDTFPFTGRKDSAEGTLSVSDALRVFAIRTLVAAKVTDANKDLISRIVRERKSSFLSTDFIL